MAGDTADKNRGGGRPNEKNYSRLRTGDDVDRDSIGSDEAPVHPVPAMQDAFEESIQEAAESDDDNAKDDKDLNAEARRRELLDRETYDASWTTRWKQRPSARCHPIVKLMSQIVFGLHLLHQRQAKSDAEVVKILQVHVDEIDAFLEKTTEDFDLAIKDIDERISFLKLPMTHIEVFDIMLDDKKFRTQLIEGNDKIEKIIERTAKAMNAALLDVQKGVNTTQQLAEYLDSVQDDWPHETSDQSAIFIAMKGNEEGWRACLRDLQGKGHGLGVALVQLGTVVGEMSKLAGAASRRNRSPTSAAHSPLASPRIRSTRQQNGRPPPRQIMNLADKPLPKEPDAARSAVKATIPRAHAVTMSDRRPKPKKLITSPSTKKSAPLLFQSKPQENNRKPARPMEPRSPTSPSTSQTKELAGFIKSSGPRPSAPERTPSTQNHGLRSLPSQRLRQQAVASSDAVQPLSQAILGHQPLQPHAMKSGIAAQPQSRPLISQRTSDQHANDLSESTTLQASLNVSRRDSESSQSPPNSQPLQGISSSSQTEHVGRSQPQTDPQPQTISEPQTVPQAPTQPKGIAQTPETSRPHSPSQARLSPETDFSAPTEAFLQSYSPPQPSTQPDPEPAPQVSSESQTPARPSTSVRPQSSQAPEAAHPVQPTHSSKLSHSSQAPEAAVYTSDNTIPDTTRNDPTQDRAQVANPVAYSEPTIEVNATPRPNRTKAQMPRPDSAHAPEALPIQVHEPMPVKAHIPFDPNAKINGPNALSAVAHRQTDDDKSPQQQVYSGPYLIPEMDTGDHEISQMPPPQDGQPSQSQPVPQISELDSEAERTTPELDATPSATPVPQEPRLQPSAPITSQSQTVPTINPPPAVRTRGQVQMPTASQVQSSMNQPDYMQTVQSYDPRALHRNMQERSRLIDNGQGKVSIESHPTDSSSINQYHDAPSEPLEPLRNHKSPDSSKVDSAYALSSDRYINISSATSSQVPSRAPSRLGLFPDPHLTTPPQSARAASFNISQPSPPFSSRSVITPKNYAHSSKGNKFSRFFKRKTRDQYAYVSVSPD